MHLGLRAVLAAVTGLLTFAHVDRAVAQPRYQVTPLGPLYPADINEHGQVAGALGAELAGRRAALWLPAAAYGLAAGLNELSHPQFATPAVGVTPGSINDLGQIVATGYRQGSTSPRAALWLPSAAHGRPAGWSVWDDAPEPSVGISINNSGQVAGRNPGSFVWLPAPAYGMPAGMHFHDGFVAADINESGQMTGSATAPGSTPYIYLPTAAYGRSAGRHLIPMGRPGTGMFDAFGQAINDRGQVVGHWTHTDLRGNTTNGGFLWLPEDDQRHGRPAGTVALPFRPVDINNTGFVVGGSSLWDPATGQVTNLNDLIDPASGLEVLGVSAINDAGQIVGRGRINGVEQGFLLTVPEPASLAVILVAGMATLRRQRCRGAC